MASEAASVATTVIGGITVYDAYTHQLQSIPHDSHPAPFLLQKYVDDHAKSGVHSRQYVYEKDAQFQMRMRTGPEVHREFHAQAGEEWYYVLQGEAYIRVIDGRTVKELPLPVGSCFLVPGGTPKSVQLCSGCTLLVLTRARKTSTSYPHYNKQHAVPQLTHLNNNAPEPDDPLDQLLWLCPTCGGVAHAQQFLCLEYFSQSSALVATFDAAVASGDIQCSACAKAYPTEAKTIITTDDTTLESIAAVQALIAASSSSAAQSELPASSATFPVVDVSTHPPPYHLFSWIESNRHKLAPPVCNSMIHGRACQWKVMIVGGPNQRTDYHIDDGEEWFLMIQGDMTLKVVDQVGTQFRDIRIKQGESFLLPANVPHSPQREANTIGLVIERDRFSYELDGLRWWCANEDCRAVLRTFSFRCEDLGSQLKTLIEYWYEDGEAGVARRRCPRCAQVETKPSTLAQVKHFTH